MSDADSIELPAWAQVTEKRRAHIARVTSLLVTWSQEMQLDATEAAAWYDAGRWHDALRDAAEPELRALAPDLTSYPAKMLHGPAAAARLARDGEKRVSVLEAIRWHTVGCQRWDRVGRALYMADCLEPGRAFARSDRAFLAAQVHAGAPSEAADGRGVEHLHLDADAVGRACVHAQARDALRAPGERAAGGRARDDDREHSGHEHRGRDEQPPPHLRLFHKATASGRSSFPSRSDHSSRCRTT